MIAWKWKEWNHEIGVGTNSLKVTYWKVMKEMSVFNVLPSFSGASNIDKQVFKHLQALARSSFNHAPQKWLEWSGKFDVAVVHVWRMRQGMRLAWPNDLSQVSRVLRFYLEGAEQHFGPSVDVENVWKYIFTGGRDLIYYDITTVYPHMYIPSFCESFSHHGLRISHGHLHGLCGRSHGCTPAWCSRIVGGTCFRVIEWTDEHIKSQTISKFIKLNQDYESSTFQKFQTRICGVCASVFACTSSVDSIAFSQPRGPRDGPKLQPVLRQRPPLRSCQLLTQLPDCKMLGELESLGGLKWNEPPEIKHLLDSG